MLEAFAVDRTKALISTASYLAAIGFAFVEPRISDALFVMVSLLWLVPNRRMLG